MTYDDMDCQLRLAQLEIMKESVLRELAETDLKGVKAMLAEQNKALKMIRTVLDDSDLFDPYSAQDSEAINAILKGLGL